MIANLAAAAVVAAGELAIKAVDSTTTAPDQVPTGTAALVVNQTGLMDMGLPEEALAADLVDLVGMDRPEAALAAGTVVTSSVKVLVGMMIGTRSVPVISLTVP